MVFENLHVGEPDAHYFAPLTIRSFAISMGVYMLDLPMTISKSRGWIPILIMILDFPIMPAFIWEGAFTHTKS